MFETKNAFESVACTHPLEEINDPPLGLGCWAFGGDAWGGQEDRLSEAVMQAALDADVFHFDTAFYYGSGHSERLIGDFLRRGQRRRDVFVASKHPFGGLSAEDAARAIDASLGNLGFDCIDLYYIHWPQSDGDMRPLMQVLERYRDAGKIRYIGVSNFFPHQMDQVREVGTIDVHQVCYNLLWRYPEKDIIPYCRQHGIRIVTYSSIAQGILTGKFPRHPEFAEGDQRPRTLPFRDDVWPHLYRATEQLRPLCEKTGRSMTHLAIRWVISRGFVDSALVGARNEEQLRDNVAALDGEIDPEIFEEMTSISDEAIGHLPEDEWNIFGLNP